MSSGKRGWLCVCLAALVALLGGCMASIPEEKASTGQTLPPVRSGPEVRVGDSQSARQFSATLYIPSPDASRLNTRVQRIEVVPGQTQHEALVTTLLRRIDESDFHAGTDQIRLASVSNAVETAGDLVTVNLYRSVRTITDLQKQYALRMAIVNTLTELPDVQYVNVLVDGRETGMDVAETIPSGLLTRLTGNDVALYWSQQEAARQEGGEIRRPVALYFVSEDGQYLLGEARNMTFAGSGSGELAKALLGELAKGATRISGARTLVPGFDWFERDPVAVETEDGLFVELYFLRQLNDFLTLKGSTQAMMLSSICYTLTSFIPRLSGIIAYVDGEMVTEMTLMNGEKWEMASGRITRDSVAALAADTCVVYYPLADGSRLYPLTRPIAQRLRTQPRALMRELMKAPTEPGLAPALPEGISDADILGLQIQDDTALLNVSSAFADACRDMTAQQERNMIYAIVNTLTEIEGVTRVRIFVQGTQARLAGHLFIGGEFMRHPGLIYWGALPGGGQP